MSEAIPNEDAVVETIARAINPGALWEEPDGPIIGWTDWWGDDWKRVAARRAARRVIAALGLTEEQKVGPYIGPDAREFGHVRSRLVTPWKEDEE